MVYVYDWDTVLISDNVTISEQLNLCSDGFAPCALQLRGDAQATINVLANGRFVCLSGAGCSQISVRSVVFACSSNIKSLFQMKDSSLSMWNVSLAGCQSDSDGGVVQAYYGAVVKIAACRFTDVYSNGFGGAVAAYGSNLSISDSLFHNCSSRSGGGAVWTSAFQDCYGSNGTQNTELYIIWSNFSRCSTSGFGGAVFADSSALLGGEVLDVTILFSKFSLCTSVAEGGGLRISGALVVTQVQYTYIESCKSDSAGGAVSSSGFSSLSMMACSLNDNTAQGTGGGAMHLNQSLFSAFNLSICNNRAPWGGGGALLWQGWVNSTAIKCPAGTCSVQASCAANTSSATSCELATCAPCAAGTFQNQTDGLERSSSENILDFSFCGANNSALYGPCIASDYKTIQVSELVESVYTGVPFYFAATKQDAYGNTILSDSSSVMEAIPSTKYQEVDPHTLIIGSAVSKMSAGVVSFLFSVKTTFANINYANQTTLLVAPVFLSLTSQVVDAESGLKMNSGLVPVRVQQGAHVCPPGYILVPDQQGAVNGMAVCTLCKPGTYSVNPLAHLPGFSIDSLSCFSCPVGCDCTEGGADIRCTPGLWDVIDGIYKVVGCPAGYQLINSSSGTSQGIFSSDLQQCKACLPGQYIINPDIDICQECPAGLVAKFFQSIEI